MSAYLELPLLHRESESKNASDFPLPVNSSFSTSSKKEDRSKMGEWLESGGCLVPLAFATMCALLVLVLWHLNVISKMAYITSTVGLTFVFTLEIITRAIAMTPSKYKEDKQCVLDVFITTLDWCFILSGYWSAAVLALRFIRVLTLLKLFRINHTRHSSEYAEAQTLDEGGVIIRYNPGKLFSWGFIFNLHGSVLGAPEIYVQFFVLAILSTLYALNMCADDCSHAFVSALPTKGTESCSDYCFSPIGSTNGLVFGSLVAFLLGLFNSLTFSRWWDMRVKLGN